MSTIFVRTATMRSEQRLTPDFVPQPHLDGFDLLCHFRRGSSGHHCDLVGLEPLDEVQFENVALLLWPPPQRARP